MAKQRGDRKLSGSIGDTTYYMVNGKGFAKQKSTLDKKKMLRDPRFKRTLESSDRLKVGSPIGSYIYQTYFPGIRNNKFFNQLTGEAVLLLKERYTGKEALEIMEEKYKPVEIKSVSKKSTKKKIPVKRKHTKGATKTKNRRKTIKRSATRKLRVKK